MSDRGIVIINGQKYDAATGLPIRSEQKNSATGASSSTVSSDFVHKKTQHSTTLNRKYTHKPKAQVANQKTAVQQAALAQFKRRHEIAEAHNQAMRAKAAGSKHKLSLKPLPNGDVIAVKKQPTQPSDAVVPHTSAVKANQALRARRPVVKRHLSANEMKQRDIEDAFSRIADEPDTKSSKKTKSPKSRRLAGVLSMAAAIALLAGYLTYLNIPAISVRIAAIQSGIDVTYPGYKPLGYDIHGLATVQNDSVAMEFGNDSNSYTITQQKSSWDSSAVLSNYVQSKWGTNYAVSKEHGLTIYTNGGKAAWVNGGIFYTIDGPADISDQVEKIAISL